MVKTMLLPNDGTSEHQYLNLVRDIKANGDVIDNDRTGVGTLSVHGRTMRFDLRDGSLPLLTTKRVSFRSIVHELLWFLTGESNIRPLLLNNVTIWSDWPYQKFVKANGPILTMAEFEDCIRESEAFAQQWGDLGPVYGVQWRRWQGPDGKVYDQISDVIRRLKETPHSRRLLFHGWNVADVDSMALPPCHLLYQFYVAQGRLSMTLYQRSCDTALGVPFNIASAAVLVHLVAKEVGLEPGELFWVGHDVHLYQNHLEPIEEQLGRTPRPFPKLILRRKAADLFDYRFEDLKLVGYKPYPSIKMPVAV